jgi:hypothetical protein
MCRIQGSRCVIAFLASAALSLAAGTSAQQTIAANSVTANQAVANKVALKKFVEATNKLSPDRRKHLSRSMQNYLLYASAAVNGTTPAAANRSTVSKQRWQKGSSFASGLIAVSDPALDPATQGYTQNTTSSAWCGKSVVVGYEDTGASLRTDPSEAFGVPISFNGVSFSGNAGKSFSDLGFLPPGTFSANVLIGDPAVTCSSDEQFQYASILNTSTPDGFFPLIGPSISFSTDGGKKWSAPQMVVTLDGSTQLADNPWLAVDPTDTQRLYLSYTLIDMLDCNSIDVVRSTNGGKNWSAPVVVAQECLPNDPFANPNTVEGARIAVGEDGKVYIAYEFFPGFNPDAAQINAIDFAGSTNHGETFSKPLRIAQLVPSGTGVELNGHLLVDEYPQIAVDRGPGPARGTLYVVYPDGRNHIVADANSASGTYAYPDIFVAKSTNGGKSFSVLGAISPKPKDFRGVGRDQFLPGMAMDKDGEVAVCYYDRRNDAADLRVDRFCSTSSNQGRTWNARQMSHVDWLPSQNADPLKLEAGFAISAYDALTGDFLRHADGFFGAFVVELSGNQNVVATKF